MRKYRRFYFLLLSLSLICKTVLAVPAYNKQIHITTIFGDTVYITIHGDERFSYALSEDGYTIINDGNTWRYATLNDDGYLVPTSHDLCKIGREDDATRLFKQKTNRNIALKATRNTSTPTQIRKKKINKANYKLTGEKHALVVLMEFQDVRFKKSIDTFNHFFNEIGYSQDNAKGSVRDYYKFASQGQLDFISDVYGPYTAKYNMKYYGQNTIQGDKSVRAYELCEEAVRNLPSDIDYSIYDSDNDGIIDNLHIIFAGYGEEAGASADAIWSHEYPHKLYMRQIIGYDLAGYSCTPELRGRSGAKLSHIGVVCHELGHALGANDYYDADYAVGGLYEGTGLWDIMASGSWNDEGASPPNFNPYVRTHDFGWNDVVEIRSSDSIVMPMMKNGNKNDTPVLRLSTPDNSDYYLIENRQKKEFDSSLIQGGLMIYHVHPDIEKKSISNTINNTHPQGLYPVCAKGSDAMHGKYGDINSANCPFPGNEKIREFSPTTIPSSKSWSGENALYSLYDITQLSDGSILFNTTNDGDNYNWDEPTDTIPSDYNVVYSESFENGLPYNYSVYPKSGNLTWTITSGISLNPFQTVDSASDGKKMATLSLKKGVYLAESEIKSCCIPLTPGHQYLLKIDARKSDQNTSDIMKISLDNDKEEICSKILHDLSQEWETIEIPFSTNKNEITINIYGKTITSSLYIDNVRIIDNKPLTVINTNKSTIGSPKIYDLSGRTTISNTKDIYIINGKKVLKY